MEVGMMQVGSVDLAALTQMRGVFMKVILPLIRMQIVDLAALTQGMGVAA